MSLSSESSRPDPDALLARLQSEEGKERRGRLKIFFGMCAGVGKTYAMLEEAHERKAAGMEVVVGYVETHGRKETDALIAGLEVIEPQWIDYRGVRLREFDLDAALKRRPELIVVDELAHSNADGLRHVKRWQDVLELLDAGIHVYTTVNVQHVESLNDVIAQISGIVVRETIPDSIIEKADQIEVIDLPPDDLLQRLREGKVYVPEQARQATDRFFRRENLAALRELALRTTADRVNLQVQVDRAGQSATRPWATQERLLVCIGPSPLSARVVRAARRIASSLHAEWIAATVETPRQTKLAERRAVRHLRMAEQLGAETAVLSGENVAEELVAYAVKRNVTKIIIGKPEQPRWKERLFGSIVDDLIRISGEIAVHVVKGGGEEDAPLTPRTPAKPRQPIHWRGYAWAAAVMIGCTLVAWPLRGHFKPANLTMVFLVGVVFVATRFGGGSAIMASILSPLLFNFFLTRPYYTFVIADTEYVLSFFALLLVALVVSGLTQRVRRQRESERARYLRTIALYFMSRRLAGAADVQSMVDFAARHIADVFNGDVVILIPAAAGRLEIAAHHGEFIADHPNERAAAQWVFDQKRWAGRGTDTLPACKAIYMPLVTTANSLGILGLCQRDPEAVLEPEQRHLLDAFATQLAIALERTEFSRQADDARRQAETEEIRSSLLSCVSHDLRTPLAAIAGSASTLIENEARLSPEQRSELLASIGEEADRMSHLVSKLLDMTRIESPGFQLQLEWYPLEELVGSALHRLENQLRRHEVVTHVGSELPLLRVDGLLIEELLSNLIENAARYSPAGTTITIQASKETHTPAQVRIEVLDEGPGIPPGAERDIFQKFHRQEPRQDRRGTGLGLAICDTIIRLHGGRIGAANRESGGAKFWCTLPLQEQPTMPDVKE